MQESFELLHCHLPRMLEELYANDKLQTYLPQRTVVRPKREIKIHNNERDNCMHICVDNQDWVLTPWTDKRA